MILTVTHALRSSEYHDRNAQYEWVSILFFFFIIIYRCSYFFKSYMYHHIINVVINITFIKIQQAAGLKKVILNDFSRLNFTYTVLSKRKLQLFIEKKIVERWDDPRFPTIQGNF